MDSLSYKTKSTKKKEVKQLKQKVYLDASNKPLGRLASKIAFLLRGKHKSYFSPEVDCSDDVFVINAEKIYLGGKNYKESGRKWTSKLYIRHTGYPGGQRKITAKELFGKNPIRLLEKAVKGMLPKNKLSNLLIKNMHVCVGTNPKYEAQKTSVKKS